jgi:hypothetical protein
VCTIELFRFPLSLSYLSQSKNICFVRVSVDEPQFSCLGFAYHVTAKYRVRRGEAGQFEGGGWGVNSITSWQRNDQIGFACLLSKARYAKITGKEDFGVLHCQLYYLTLNRIIKQDCIIFFNKQLSAATTRELNRHLYYRAG